MLSDLYVKYDITSSGDLYQCNDSRRLKNIVYLIKEVNLNKE